MQLEDCTSAIFDGMDLRHINHSFKDYTDASFRGSNLKGCNFIGCVARGALFHGTNLEDAKMMGMPLIGADFSGANLSGANLGGADLRGSKLAGANLADINAFGTIGNGEEIVSIVARFHLTFVVPTKVVWVGCKPFTMPMLLDPETRVSHLFTASQTLLFERKRDFLISLANEIFYGGY